MGQKEKVWQAPQTDRALASGLVDGWLYDTVECEFYRGWVQWDEKGQVVGNGKGARPQGTEPTASGVILPPLVNWHTHLGDTGFRTQFKALGEAPDLGSVVGPNGYKSRWLGRASQKELKTNLLQGLGENLNGGVGTVVDFREGGIKGAEALAKLQRSNPQTIILGRPGPNNSRSEEIGELLEVCDGLGVSAMRDLKPERTIEWVEVAHEQRKLVALHVSEKVHEPIEPVLELKPDLLVHLGAATNKDLELIAQFDHSFNSRLHNNTLLLPGCGPAIVVCPSSNQLFQAPLANVPLILELGLQVGLGTDNGMLGPPNMLREMGLLAKAYPQLSEGQLMQTVLAIPKWLNNEPNYPPRMGQVAIFGVFRGTGKGPMAQLLAPDHQCVMRLGPN